MSTIKRTEIVKINARFSSVERQAAKALGAKIKCVSLKSRTSFGPDRAYTEIFSAVGGGYIVVSANNNFLQAALVSDKFNYQWNPADESALYRNITDAAGITYCGDLAFEHYDRSFLHH